MFQRSLVPMHGIFKIMLPVIHGSEIIGRRGEARIDGKRVLVSLSRLLESIQVVVGHANTVPNQRRLQIGLLVCGNRGRVFSAGHQDLGLGLSRYLLAESLALGCRYWCRYFLGRASRRRSGSYLSYGYADGSRRKQGNCEPDFHTEERATGNLTHHSPPCHATHLDCGDAIATRDCVLYWPPTIQETAISNCEQMSTATLGTLLLLFSCLPQNSKVYLTFKLPL